MPLFSKTLEQAKSAVTKAEATVSEWDGKVAAARAEVGRLNAESGAAILADESAADRIALNVQTWELKAKAYSQASAEARQKLHYAQREALEVEARDEDKAAESLRKQSATHGAKVEALKKQLEELDGCDWTRGPVIDKMTGYVSGWQLGKVGELDFESDRHTVRAAVIRYFLQVGKVPTDYYDINTALGTSFSSLGRSIHDRDNIPASVIAARDAGLTFSEA